MASRTASSNLRICAAVAAVLAAVLIPADPASSVPSITPFRACLVTGVGGLEGPAFNRLAVAGLRAAERAGVVGHTAHAGSQAEIVNDLRSCARDRAGITIGVGYGMAAALDQVATEFPHAAFAIVGVDMKTLPHRPANVEGLLFREEQAGYLVGYAAGLWAKRQGKRAVGSVGGLDIPPVEQAVAGFQFGAKVAYPAVDTLNAYAGGFTVAASCEKLALGQIEQGSAVEFEVAGPCGLGVLAAAHAKGILGIGSGADQASLGSFVLTTALERADVAVEAAVGAARTGHLAGGTNVSFGARNGGIGYGRWSPIVPAAIRRAVAAQYAFLQAGRIEGIPTTIP